MAGLLSSYDFDSILTGDKSLSSRPMSRVTEPLKKMNANILHNNGLLPLKITRSNNFIVPIKYTLELGSAQVKSAILLASLGIRGKTSILEKIPSRNHTEIMLKYLDANLKTKGKKILLDSPNFLKAKNIHVPGDISSASFLIVAALVTKGSKIIIEDVGLNYYRIGIIEVLKKMKANIVIRNKKKLNGELFGEIEVRSSKLIATRVSSSMSPRMIDEYPILFVAAAFAKGKSSFKGLAELKFKESNRLQVMYNTLRQLGVNVKAGDDFIEIEGGGNYNCEASIKTFDDHRIAMSSLVFGMASSGSVEIDDMSMISTSFPNFKQIFEKIGAKIKVVKKY